MKDESSNVMAFDALYTNNNIQKLKVLLPYIEPSMQKNMAIYIKYMELKYTIDLFQKHPLHSCSVNEHTDKPDMKALINQLRIYSSEAELKQLEQMESILKAMEMYQEMSQTMNIMQEMFPDMGMGGNNSASMEDMLMGMLSPEQKAMFDTFSNVKSEN